MIDFIDIILNIAIFGADLSVMQLTYYIVLKTQSSDNFIHVKNDFNIATVKCITHRVKYYRKQKKKI